MEMREENKVLKCIHIYEVAYVVVHKRGVGGLGVCSVASLVKICP